MSCCIGVGHKTANARVHKIFADNQSAPSATQGQYSCCKREENTPALQETQDGYLIAARVTGADPTCIFQPAEACPDKRQPQHDPRQRIFESRNEARPRQKMENRGSWQSLSRERAVENSCQIQQRQRNGRTKQGQG